MNIHLLSILNEKFNFAKITQLRNNNNTDLANDDSEICILQLQNLTQILVIIYAPLRNFEKKMIRKMQRW